MHADGFVLEVESLAVEQLNLLLCLELDAIATYRRAVQLFSGTDFHEPLQGNAENHARRADRLRIEIEKLGGMPASAEQPWTYFVSLGEQYDETAGLEALLRGEDSGLSQYLEISRQLQGAHAKVVLTQLLPEQQKTVQALSRLHRRLH